MPAVLAHAGHSHGPSVALVALVVVILVLGVAAAGAAVRRGRTERVRERVLPG
jgi:hypothetical protein